jgi:hypothetical protein
MRRLLLALLALFWADAAVAATESNYSGLTSMTFQNGVAPTAGYAGIADATIDADSSTTNFGSNAALHAGGTSGTTNLGGNCSTVMSVDLSALPDSAIVFRARLFLYQNSLVSLVNSVKIKLYELVNPFTENQVTWTVRKTAINWTTVGALTRVSSATGIQWGSSTSDTAVGTSITAYVGMDTVGSGRYTTALFDTGTNPITTRDLKTGSGAATALKCKGWTTYDITNLVRKGNNGVATLTSWVLVADEDAYGGTGVANWFSSDFANKPYRPKIIVEYFDPTSGSSGSGGRRVIGNGPGGLH